MSYALDAFQRLWGVSPVLALRLVGAIRAGDRVAAGGFALGGVPGAGRRDVDRQLGAQSSSIGYLHGYPTRAVTGNQYHLLNVEYRQELWQIEHGLGTLPIYLRRAAPRRVVAMSRPRSTRRFDAGKNMRWSIGGALRLDAYFGYFVPGTFEIGYARGLIANGVDETWFLLTGSL